MKIYIYSTQPRFGRNNGFLGPQPEHCRGKKTLALDLDETLVHFDVHRRIFKVRPLCIRFLEELSSLYEVVIFTAAH